MNPTRSFLTGIPWVSEDTAQSLLARREDLDRLRHRFTEVGLGAGPTDRERAEAGARFCYETLGLSAPLSFVWRGSPLAALRALGQDYEDRAGEIVPLAQLAVMAGNRARIRMHVAMGTFTEDRLGAPVRHAVWDRAGAPIQAALLTASDAHSWPSTYRERGVGAAMRRAAQESWPAQFDAATLGVMAFFRDVLGLVSATRELDGLFWLADSAGWVFAQGRRCYLSERPTRVKLDREGRLHDDRGPAISFPDGFDLHAWHGTVVPGRVITDPESLSVQDIDDTRNAELRRVLIERFGYDRYLREAHLVSVHRDATGELFRRDYRDDEPLVLVRVTNSTAEPDGTRRLYTLRVPPDTRTARQAVAWTFGLTEAEYQPIAQS